MILVTRLNKASQFYVNEDMIEFIEETPDTIVTLNTGKKVTVSESAIEIVEKIRSEKKYYEYKVPKYDRYIPNALLKRQVIEDYIDLAYLKQQINTWTSQTNTII